MYEAIISAFDWQCLQIELINLRKSQQRIEGTETIFEACTSLFWCHSLGVKRFAK